MTFVLVGTVATAEAKPKIAILGLEAAVGANGKIDQTDTQFAKALTEQLRSRAGQSKLYDPTKDQRELADEKLMNNCGSEHPSCMAPIGSQMGAEVMLFGKIENAKEKGVDGWRVSLTLISVTKKPPQQLATVRNEFIAEKDAKGASLTAFAQRMLKTLTGETGEGTLVIHVVTSGVTSGTVLVDKQMKDTLKSGSATITLPEGGKYTVAVDVDGYKLWEQENVAVSADKTTELKPDLVKSGGHEDKVNPNQNPVGPDNNPDSREGTVSKGGSSKRTVLKIVAGVALGGAAVTGALWAYNFKTVSDFDGKPLGDVSFIEGTPNNPGMAHTGMDVKVGVDQCGKGYIANAGTTTPAGVDGDFKDACKAHDRTWIFAPTTIGLAAVGAGALIWVLATSDDGGKEHAMGRQRKRKNLIVTPVITPDGTGATLRLDW